MRAKKNILLVGLGSIGRRHLRLLEEYPEFKVFCLRSSRGNTPECANEVYSWRDAEKIKPWAAFITNPTALHIRTALKCARMGAHLFIEKPLDMSMALLPELERAVRRKRLSAYVAYNLRFHPGLEALKKEVARAGFWNAQVHCSSWLPDWRPGTDYKSSYSASARLGGGVVFDLSHEVDYVGWIFGEVLGISGSMGRVSDLKIKAEDSADMLCSLKGGKTVPIHIDFCSYNLERSVKVMTPGAFFHLDLISGTLLRQSSRGKTIRTYKVDRDYTYRRQLDYFLSRAGGAPMMNGLREAGRLLARLTGFKGKPI